MSAFLVGALLVYLGWRNYQPKCPKCDGNTIHWGKNIFRCTRKGCDGKFNKWF